MSRRLDGSVPTTAVGWMRREYEPSPTDIMARDLALRSRIKAMHHWIRRNDPVKAGDAARALFRGAMRELAQFWEAQRA